MNAIEQAIAAAAVHRQGHPDWRTKGDTPTYFMRADNSAYCRYWPIRSQTVELWVWQWFEPSRFGRRNPQVIRDTAHLNELLKGAPCLT